MSLSGNRWGRGDDAIGAAFVVNAASAHRLAYLADGGLGVGRLTPRAPSD